MAGTVYPMSGPALAAGIVTVLSLRFALGGFRAGLKSAAVIGLLELACGAGTGNWLMTGAGAVTLALALRGWRQHRPPASAQRARPGQGDRRQPGKDAPGAAMSTRAALAAGTVLSFTVTGAWSWMASLAIGPAAPVHLTRDLAADYAQLAAAPAGNGAGLFAVIASIYAACLLVSGWRRQRRDGA